MDFISLISNDNKNNKLICDTCIEYIESDTYLIDLKDHNLYCDTDCLANSFKFNLSFSL
jgi:hypothetical protein